MPRRNTHLVIAAISGAAVAYAIAREAGSSDPFPEILGGALGVLATAMLPDALDPATSPLHHASGHSLALGVLVSKVLPTCRRFSADCRSSAETSRGLAARPDLQPSERSNHQLSELAARFAAGFAVGLPIGFLSHLGADATTRRGLT